MKRYLYLTYILTLVSANEVTADNRKHPNISWKVVTESFTRTNDRFIECRYPNTLRTRMAKRHSDPPVHTLYFPPVASDLSPQERVICESSLTNLTGLDQERLRDEFAKILKDFPCEHLDVVTEASQDRELKRLYPNAKSLWKTQNIEIRTCLKEPPEYCQLPLKSSIRNNQAVIDYDALKMLFELCKEEVESKIKAGAELKDWQKNNDPNATPKKDRDAPHPGKT